jgi:hypothetical protein
MAVYGLSVLISIINKHLVENNLSIWYKTTTEKILAWRELRQNAVGMTVDNLIEAVNTWWTFSPWVRKTIDPYKPETWPSPWDMINKGEFCRSAIALGQAYTLWITAPNTNVELWLVNNFSEKDVHLVVVIDEKTVLNYILGHVLPIEQCDFETLNKITKSDLPHIKI